MRKLFIILFLSYSIDAFCQEDLIKLIPTDSSMQLITDNLGNSYLYDNLNILKYNTNGDSVGLYSNNRLGAISTVDVTNPYKIMVFYADYANIIFLDNFMSLLEGPIALDQLGYDQVTHACASMENGLWLFDRLRQTVIKLNQDLSEAGRSINLSQLADQQIAPKLMLEQNANLLLQTDKNGVMVFDQFGTFEKKLSVEATSPIQVINKKVMFYRNDTIFQYNSNLTSLAHIRLPIIGSKDAHIGKDRLAVLTDNALYIYKYSPVKSR